MGKKINARERLRQRLEYASIMHKPKPAAPPPPPHTHTHKEASHPNLFEFIPIATAPPQPRKTRANKINVEVSASRRSVSLRLTNPSPSRENKESEGVSSKRALLDPPTSYPRGHRGHTALVLRAGDSPKASSDGKFANTNQCALPRSSQDRACDVQLETTRSCIAGTHSLTSTTRHCFTRTRRTQKKKKSVFGSRRTGAVRVFPSFNFLPLRQTGLTRN